MHGAPTAAGVKLCPYYIGKGMKSYGLPPWSTACTGSLLRRAVPALALEAGTAAWGEVVLCEEEFQGGEGTANFVLLSDSAETNMCSTNNGVGLIVRARNCQRVSKYGKERGDT